MRVFSASIPAVAGLLLAATTAPALAAGVTELVSLGRGGVQAEGGASFGKSISANGRFVAFLSNATNLVPGDTNGEGDVFVRDRQTGRIARANVRSNGAQANSRYRLGGDLGERAPRGLRQLASNLVAGDTNRAFDVFVRDWRRGKTERVSIASDGAQGDGSSFDPATSADGRFVAFISQRDQPGAGRHQRPRRRVRPRPAGRNDGARQRRCRRRPGEQQQRRLGRGDLGRRALRRLRLVRQQPSAGRQERPVRPLRARPQDRDDGQGERAVGRERGERVQRRPGALEDRALRRLRLGQLRTSCPATRTRRTTSSSTT